MIKERIKKFVKFPLIIRRRLSNLWKWSGGYFLTSSGKLITEPGAEYNIFECSSAGVVSFLGFIDLSSLGPGDKVEINLKMSIKGEHRLNRRVEFLGPLKEPVIDFPKREGINPIVSLRQVTGVSREIRYIWKWIKL